MANAAGHSSMSISSVSLYPDTGTTSSATPFLATSTQTEISILQYNLQPDDQWIDFHPATNETMTDTTSIVSQNTGNSVVHRIYLEGTSCIQLARNKEHEPILYASCLDGSVLGYSRNEWMMTTHNTGHQSFPPRSTTAALTTEKSNACPLFKIRNASNEPISQISVVENIMATASKDGMVGVYDLETQKPISQMQGHKGWVRCVSLGILDSEGLGSETASANYLVASGGSDKTVRLWDIRAHGVSAQNAVASQVAVLQGHEGWVHDVVLCSNGNILSTGGDKNVIVWDLSTLKPRMVLKGHELRAWSVAVSADAMLAASCSSDSTVRLWDIRCESEQECINNSLVLKGHKEGVLCVDMSRDGKLCVSGSEDGRVRLWNVDSIRKHGLRAETGSKSSQLVVPGVPVVSVDPLVPMIPESQPASTLANGGRQDPQVFQLQAMAKVLKQELESKTTRHKTELAAIQQRLGSLLSESSRLQHENALLYQRVKDAEQRAEEANLKCITAQMRVSELEMRVEHLESELGIARLQAPLVIQPSNEVEAGVREDAASLEEWKFPDFIIDGQLPDDRSRQPIDLTSLIDDESSLLVDHPMDATSNEGAFVLNSSPPASSPSIQADHSSSSNSYDDGNDNDKGNDNRNGHSYGHDDERMDTRGAESSVASKSAASTIQARFQQLQVRRQALGSTIKPKP